MIFCGPGQGALLNGSISERDVMEGWQLKQGDFSALHLKEKTLTDFFTEKTVLDGLLIINCHLESAVFEKSQLHDGVFDGSSLNDCHYISCVSHRLFLTGSRFNGCCFRGCSLPRLNIESCVMHGGSFTECEVNRALVQTSVFIHVTFSAEHASGLTGFISSAFTSCLFICCNFSFSVLEQVEIRNCLFLGCRFSGGPDLNTKLDNRGGSWASFKEEILCLQD